MPPAAAKGTRRWLIIWATIVLGTSAIDLIVRATSRGHQLYPEAFDFWYALGIVFACLCVFGVLGRRWWAVYGYLALCTVCVAADVYLSINYIEYVLPSVSVPAVVVLFLVRVSMPLLAIGIGRHDGAWKQFT